MRDLPPVLVCEKSRVFEIMPDGSIIVLKERLRDIITFFAHEILAYTRLRNQIDSNPRAENFALNTQIRQDMFNAIDVIRKMAERITKPISSFQWSNASQFAQAMIDIAEHRRSESQQIAELMKG